MLITYEIIRINARYNRYRATLHDVKGTPLHAIEVIGRSAKVAFSEIVPILLGEF